MTPLASQTVLAYFPSPPQGVWHLGPIPIRAYAFFIITGIVIALLIGDRRYVARGGEKGVVYDIALWIVPLGLIGGRLYHLATDWQTYFGPGGAGLGAALRIWDGGLGIWGAVALGAVGAWIGCRRHGMELPTFLDAVAPGVVLAQAIGRLGNYFNQELYGRPTTVPWGLEIFDRQDSAGFVDVHLLDGVSTGHVHAVVHPTFLYELLWNVLVFVLLLYLDRRFSLGHGRLFASYVALYCIGRFGVELLRDDTATHIAGIRVNSFTSTFVFIGAVVYIMLAPKGREDRNAEKASDEAEVDEEALQPDSELVAVRSTAAATAAGTAVATDDDEAVDATESGQVGEDVEPASVTDEVAEPETEPAGEVDDVETERAEETAAVAESAAAEVEPEALEGEPEVEVEPAESEEAAGVTAEVAEVEPEAEAAEGEPELEVEEAAGKPEPEVEEAEGEPAEVAEAEPESEAAEGEPELEAEEPAGATVEEPEVAEAEPESEAAEDEPELQINDTEAEGAEAEPAEPMEAVADEATVIEAATAQVDEPEVAELEPESEVAETDADAVDVAEPEQAEPAVAEPENLEPQADSPTDETETEAEPDTDEPPGHESAGEGDQSPAGPAPDALPEAAAARQRWRFPRRRQRP